MNFHVKIKVVPKASKSEIVGWEEDTLKVRLKAVPEKGEANEELIALFSKILHLPKSQIHLTHGLASRRKTLKIEGISEEEFSRKVTAGKSNKSPKKSGSG